MAQTQTQTQAARPILEELKEAINEVGKTLDKINQLREGLKAEPESIGRFMYEAVEEILALQKRRICELVSEVRKDVYAPTDYSGAGWLRPDVTAKSISILTQEELKELVDEINKGLDEQYKKFENLRDVTLYRINNNKKMHLTIISYIYGQLCEIVHGVVEALAHINCVAHGCPCSVVVDNDIMCGQYGDGRVDEYAYCGDYPSLEEIECCDPFDECERLDELVEEIEERSEQEAED